MPEYFFHSIHDEFGRMKIGNKGIFGEEHEEMIILHENVTIEMLQHTLLCQMP